MLSTLSKLIFLNQTRSLPLFLIRIQTLRNKPRVRRKVAYEYGQSNAGVRRQMEIFNFNQENESNSDDVDSEDIENLEGDFSKVTEIYDEHEREVEMKREQWRKSITVKKCFKTEPSPNLLTWGEKEQIRYLHREDPVEWPAERLANSFPATETIVKKILKSNWKPRSAEQLLSHDNQVQEHWKLFNSGKLKLDPKLHAHVSKFAARRDTIMERQDTTELMKSLEAKPKVRHPLQKSEFESIIESFNEVTKKNDEESREEEGKDKKTIIEEIPNELSPPPTGDSYVMETTEKHTWKHLTLNKYKEKYLDLEDSTSDDNSLDSSIENKKIRTFKDIAVESKVSVEKSDRISSQLAKLGDSDDEIEDKILPRIKIPKDKWVKGKTYKFGDCFYDDDGKFLYRVPGLTGADKYA